MPNGYAPQEIGITSKVVGASLTNEPISREFHVTANGSLNLVVKLKVAAVTVGAGITAKLQTAIDGDWVDAKTVAVTATGDFYIKLQAAVAGDQAFLPLLSAGRLVLTTGAGSTATVTSVNVLEDL